MLTWFMTAALAAPCPSLRETLAQAWAAFDDAEVERAEKILGEAGKTFSCQVFPVFTSELLELYRLDALVALAQSDARGANDAAIRAATVDVDAVPPSELGPGLAELSRVASARLRERPRRMVSVDVGEGWVDGRLVSPSAPIFVIPGDHLIQWIGPGSFHSEMRDVTEDFVVVTGLPLPVALAPTESETAVSVTPVPTPTVRHAPVLRPVLLIGAVSVAATGGALLGVGYWDERRFSGKAYDAYSYNGCTFSEECYADEREAAIRSDAGKIRALYGTGYTLLGVGAALLGTGLVVAF